MGPLPHASMVGLLICPVPNENHQGQNCWGSRWKSITSCCCCCTRRGRGCDCGCRGGPCNEKMTAAALVGRGGVLFILVRCLCCALFLSAPFAADSPSVVACAAVFFGRAFLGPIAPKPDFWSARLVLLRLTFLVKLIKAAFFPWFCVCKR